jgi:hypothetical protein
MQFIDFKKEHFTKDEETGNYLLEISKDEVGYGDIKVKQKQDDDTFAEADYELIDDGDQVKIIMKTAHDIRVNF